MIDGVEWSPTTVEHDFMSNSSDGTAVINIAQKLRESAAAWPHQRAVVFPSGRDPAGRVTYSHLTFQQLDQETDRLARGLRNIGVTPGTRLVLMVRPSLEFIALTFALFKTGAVVVLIDPGMGRTGIFNCLKLVEPQGFIAIPLVQAIRVCSGSRFKHAKLNVTVGGRRWFWGGPNYRELLGGAWEPFEITHTIATAPAAIIFTSGSTGPPKGVLYEHGMFAAQVELLQEFYQIKPGEIDLPGFPLFALFNSAMGVTTVIPDMDPTRPAKVDPAKILEAIDNQGVTQAFGSPAIWNRVGRYCEATGRRLPSLGRVLSAGAPVPVAVIERILRSFPITDPLSDSSDLPGDQSRRQIPDIHTPYGATESLPVCSISGREVVSETAAQSRQGAGTCVGRLFPRMQLKIIEITTGPISALSQVRELPAGEIGEIIVSGPVVTREYFRNPDATQNAKIPDGDRFWHRMGDVGYLDAQQRLWFCGRKAHVVETATGNMFTICCEAIFNQHPQVYRSALVGIPAGSDSTTANKDKVRVDERPVIIIEPETGHFPQTSEAQANFRDELLKLGQANPLTQKIQTVLFHPALPVDIRHNVKIDREALSAWAEGKLL
ncbi:MAG: lcfB 1 [Planctomycetaceae bacterium]|nr:lcfB 1 [Planctomycetaceae bacterium]